jgi:hypothetical protein
MVTLSNSVMKTDFVEILYHHVYEIQTEIKLKIRLFYF